MILKQIVVCTQVMDRDVENLSGGELQRFAMAVVAAQEADVYMIDEPSSYLDVRQRLKAAQVRQLSNRAVMEPVDTICSRMLRLSDGINHHTEPALLPVHVESLCLGVDSPLQRHSCAAPSRQFPQWCSHRGFPLLRRSFGGC